VYVTCTCAHAHTRAHTLAPHRQTRKCLTVAVHPQPYHFVSVAGNFCQIKAWKAGHKGECAAAAAADHMRVLEMLRQLADDASDWRGVAAQEPAARSVAAAVRTSMPDKAAWVYCTLGIAYRSLGNLPKAIEYHEEHLTFSKELGNRAWEGQAYGNLGNVCWARGDNLKAIEYHEQDLAIAKEVGDRAGEGQACANLGIVYHAVGDYSKAIEYHEQDLAIAKEVGDRVEEGQSYGNLGIVYHSLGHYCRAIAHHAKNLAIAKEEGDEVGECLAYGNLGLAYHSVGDYSEAIEYHAKHLAMKKKVGDRAGEGGAYANLGIVYHSLGDYSKAMEYESLRLAIAKEVGDRAGEGGAYGNLALAYRALGDFSKAIEYELLHLAIAKEVGDRPAEGRAYGSLGNAYHAQHLAIAKELGDQAGKGQAEGILGTCHMHSNEFDKAVAYFEAQHALALSLKLARMQSDAAMDMGIALTLDVRAARAARLGSATDDDQGPGPHSHSLASACLNDRVSEAAKWLQAAFDGGHNFAKLHLARLTFDAGQEDAALAHLKEHLSWRVRRDRDICAGCGQMRGTPSPVLCAGMAPRSEKAPMLTCSGCRVAKFCSADHQKMASKKAALGGSLRTGRHKDICRILSKWRGVVKDGVAPDSCTADLVAFLQQ